MVIDILVYTRPCSVVCRKEPTSNGDGTSDVEKSDEKRSKTMNVGWIRVEMSARWGIWIEASS